MQNKRNKYFTVTTLAFLIVFAPAINGYSQEPDSTFPEYKIDNLTFGFCWNNKYLMYPSYIDPPISDEESPWPPNFSKFIDSISADDQSQNGIDFFKTLPREQVAYFVKNQIGDTVTMIWSGNLHRGKITEYGYLEMFCSGGLFCIIQPFDSIPKDPPDYFTYLTITRSEPYNGPIITFQKCTFSYSTKLWLSDTLATLMQTADFNEKNSQFEYDYKISTINARNTILENWESWKRKPLPEFQSSFMQGFNESCGEQNDSIFVALHEERFVMGGWFGLYKFYTNPEKRLTTLIPLQHWLDWDAIFEMDCAFDLNHDGNLEYLVQKAAMAAIYTYIDGKFTLVWGCNYRGCG
jgi:hypothetical protein